MRLGTKIYLAGAAALFLLTCWWVVAHSYLVVSLGTVLLAVFMLAVFLFWFVPLYLHFRGKL